MVTGDGGLSHNRACTWLRRLLSCQLCGPRGSLRALVCACCILAFVPSWLRLAMVMIWFECGYFCLLFHWLYLCKTDLVKLQNFMQQISGSVAMFSSFVIHFSLQHIYWVLYEKHESRQAKLCGLNHHSILNLAAPCTVVAVCLDRSHINFAQYYAWKTFFYKLNNYLIWDSSVFFQNKAILTWPGNKDTKEKILYHDLTNMSI